MFLHRFVFHAILTEPNSRVWHQVLRRGLTTNADFLARAFHVPRGKCATYLKLFTSFFISGLVHAAADYPLHQNFFGGNAIQFFVLQAVAITFEDAVIGIASRLGYKESKSFKLIGFIWAFAWFSFCMPMCMEPLVRGGMIDGQKYVSGIQGCMELLHRLVA